MSTFMLFLWFVFAGSAAAAVNEVDSSNYYSIIKHHDIVFLNFYADWCRFSAALEPVFDQFAKEAMAKFNGNSSRNLYIGRVNYDRNEKLSKTLSISKFPTFKLYRFGTMVKTEYRGPRTLENLTEYIEKEFTDPVKRLEDPRKMFEASGRTVVLDLHTNDDLWLAFNRSARVLREHCDFLLADQRTLSNNSAANRVYFTSSLKPNGKPIAYTKSPGDLLLETTNFCIPLVREITFENAEQITDEGRQLLILFHRPNDNETLLLFEQVLSNPELKKYQNNLNFLHADGVLFNHPLKHVGRSINDLPLVVIDSFQHMYLMPDISMLREPSRIRQWIEKFLSGDLHKELHMDMMSKILGIPIRVQTFQISFDSQSDNNQQPGHDDRNKVIVTQGVVEEANAKMPDSVFSKLAPSNNRYTFTRDEL